MNIIITRIIKLFYGSSKGFFNRPVLKTPMQQRLVDLQFIGPISQQHSLSSKTYWAHNLSISTLYQRCCPPTIFFIVIFATFNSIYRCISLPMLCHMRQVQFIHIVPKFFKRVPTAFYSSSTIVFVARRFFPFTTISHISVDTVKACIAHTMIFFRQISTHTIATLSLRRWIYYVLDSKHFFVSTVAFEQPVSSGATRTHWFNSCQFSKFLSSNIFHNFLPQKAGRFASILP